MKSSLFAMAVVTALWISTAAFGQRLEVDIPFEFSAGTTVLPSGTYSFSFSPEGRTLVVSRERRERARLPLVTRLAHSSPFDDSRLVFDQVEGQNRLAEVWMDRSEGALVLATYEGHKHVVLHLHEPVTIGMSGKAAFAATCLHCHGAGGKGDRVADAFFKKRLPRLTSDYVQDKTDAELKEIITAGHGDMDPVRVGTGKKRLLPEAAVDAVIVHVRALKKS